MTLPPEWQLAFTVAGAIWCVLAVGAFVVLGRIIRQGLRDYAELGD